MHHHATGLDAFYAAYFAAYSSLIVAVIYVVIGALILPSLRFSLRPLLYGALFFFGCAGTHVLLASSLISPLPAPVEAWAMVAVHAMQIVGGVGFAREVSRKRLLVRLEEDRDAGS